MRNGGHVRLRAVRMALRPGAANEDANEAPKPSAGSKVIERTVYVDEAGEKVLEVVRLRPSAERYAPRESTRP